MKTSYKLLLLASVAMLAFTGCENKGNKEGEETAQTEEVKEVTADNLKNAIMGELTASAKYAAFSEKAKEEGFVHIATLYAAVSKAEAIHAENHQKVLAELGVTMDPFTPTFEVKTTAENLQASIDGETEEFTNMYPAYIEAANTEGRDKAARSFTWANDTEKKHAALFTSALAALNADGDKAVPAEYYVCPVCGNTWDGATVLDTCDFCGTAKDAYITFK